MKTKLIPILLGASIALAAPAAAAEESATDQGSVVVTTEVLGSIVEQLAGDIAGVEVLMEGGADPHSWQPSARDSEAVFAADLVVANGLDLEEGLATVLEQAEEDGVPVFHAADHVELRASAGAADGHSDADHADHEADADHSDPEADHEEADHEAEADHDDHQHGHAAGDPHFWLDPLAMRDVVLSLGPVLDDIGVDVGDGARELATELEALDAELEAILSDVPDEQRQLVTGHGALGYFADRYEFEIVGTVVPGLSSADEPSAREIAGLIDDIRAAGATAVFTDVGTPRSVARAVADEAGASVVELQVAQLPEGGSYQDLLRELARQVAEALTSAGDED